MTLFRLLRARPVAPRLPAPPADAPCRRADRRDAGGRARSAPAARLSAALLCLGLFGVAPPAPADQRPTSREAALPAPQDAARPAAAPTAGTTSAPPHGSTGLGLRPRPDGRVVVYRVLDGSPAARAGLRAGDVLVAVGGEPVEKLAGERIVEAMQGTAGTAVRIAYRRGEQPATEVALLRERPADAGPPATTPTPTR